jgi:Ca2+-binding RTX toxin-like protein
VTATDLDGPSITFSVVTPPVHGTLTAFNPATGAFTYTPDENFFGPDSFTFQATDGTNVSNTATVVINVTAVNDAPVLSDDAVIPAILQGTTNPPGRVISALFSDVFEDADGNALAGVAIIGNPQDANQGTWQYSTDGTTWFAVGTVADGATALALSATTRLRFLAEPFFSGDPKPLTVRALDSTFTGTFTSGATRATVNTTTNGGTTAISAATQTVQNPIFPGDVPGAWLSATGDLFVSGTAANDKIAIQLVKDAARVMHVVVKLNGTTVGDFLQSAVTGRVVARGLGGNDTITAPATLTSGVDMYGGTGNDKLTGGAGPDRLFGEDGNDTVTGGKGNDLLVGGTGNDTLTDTVGLNVLIGGAGADKLTGGTGSDLLVGGSTSLDANLLDLTGLTNVMAEWTSAASYTDKVAHLSGTAGGLNNGTFLTAATVQNDNVKDTLAGKAGLDWFLSSTLDVLTGAGTGEMKTTI